MDLLYTFKATKATKLSTLQTKCMIKTLNIKDDIQLLKDNYIGHLAFIYLKRPYVVPITYYYDESNNSIVSYSGEGHKINAMRINNKVSIEVNEIESINQWRSVLVHGEFEELENGDAKFQLHKFAEGVRNNILQKQDKELKFINEFSSKVSLETDPVVYRINISEMTGKRRAL